MSWRSDQLDHVDLESYLRSRVEILNTGGGRGYDTGVRTFQCVWCDDAGGRGWLNVDRGTAGCFNAGCPAEPRVDGGAFEWIRGVEGFQTIGRTVAYLRESFPARGKVRTSPKPPESYQDFCRFPKESMLFGFDAPLLQVPYVDFAKRQWGLDLQDLKEAQARWCSSGYYAGRIIFPIVMGGKVVAFQARSKNELAQAKYLTSRFGKSEDPTAECGRPADALLYGVDEVEEGDEILLVEGIGDVLALRMARRRGIPCPQSCPVGLLGVQLSSEKIAILGRLVPKRVIPALDTEAETEEIAEEAARALMAWGIDSAVGVWKGAKDPGAGGRLEIKELGLKGRISKQLGV